MSHEQNERGPEGTPPDQQHHVHHDVRPSLDDVAAIAELLRRRRDASLRLAPLDSGRRDPWHSPPLEPTEPNREASRRAWLHLRDHGLLSEHVETFLRERAA